MSLEGLILVFHILNLSSNITAIKIYVFFREKKREKDREELWKRLAELELNHNKNLPNSTGGGGLNSSNAAPPTPGGPTTAQNNNPPGSGKK